MQLREHQETAIDMVRHSLKKGNKNVILAAPCSMGKTMIAASIMISAAERRGKRSIFYCDRTKLVRQTIETFERLGADYSVLQADDWRFDPSKPIQIASIQTAVRRQQLDYDLAIIDECHTMYKGFCDGLMANYNNVPHIGLTATPYSKGLGKYYSDLIVPITTRGLLEKGYLTPTDYYAGHQANISSVKMKRLATGGTDYDPKGLEQALMSDKTLAGDIIENYVRHASGKRAIAFTPSIAHSKQLTEKFNQAGIKAIHIDGMMDQGERDIIYRAFNAGLYTVCCCSRLLTVGFDDPGVECLIDCAPSKSVIRNVQVAGRIWRTAPGKERAIYLDHAGNIQRLGMFPEDVVPESLDDGEQNYNERKLVKKEKKEAEPVQCPQCTRMFVGKCVCGYERSRTKEIITDDQILQKMNLAQDHRRWLASLQLYAHQKGYQRGWIYHTFKKKFKTEPKDWPRPAAQVDPDVMGYIKHLNIARAKSGTNLRAA